MATTLIRASAIRTHQTSETSPFSNSVGHRLTGPEHARLDEDQPGNQQPGDHRSQEPHDRSQALANRSTVPTRRRKRIPTATTDDGQSGIEHQLRRASSSSYTPVSIASSCTDQGLGGDRGGDRGDDDRRHVTGGEGGEDHLEGEQHPGDGGVERGADPSPGAGGHQGSHLVFSEVEALRDHRSDRAADLDDRALPTGRATRSQRSQSVARILSGMIRARILPPWTSRAATA